jgi:DNA-binding transcriptional regulator YdaS (Cro superfamily)
MAKGPKGKSFDDATNEALRKVVRELVKQHGTAMALAEVLGVSQPTVSTFLSGKHGAGPELASKIASARGQTLAQLLAGTAPGVTRNASLPGWKEASLTAQRKSGLPLWCFELAAMRQAIRPEMRATPEYVTAEAQLALTFASEDDARRLTNQEIDEKPERKSRGHIPSR